jgi:hypothetical protein
MFFGLGHPNRDVIKAAVSFAEHLISEHT